MATNGNIIYVMNETEAKEFLLLHGFAGDLKNPKMASGFLGSLRPYRGLNESNFHEIMAALRVLAPHFAAEQLDRKLISALWTMGHLARAWGVHPEGMLRRNNLIEEADWRRLEEWIDTISYAVFMLLEGDETAAFDGYENRKSAGERQRI